MTTFKGIATARIVGMVMEPPRVIHKSNGPPSIMIYVTSGIHTPPGGRAHECRHVIRSYRAEHVALADRIERGDIVEATGRLAATTYTDASDRVWATGMVVIDQDGNGELSVKEVEV
jgi:hypothetical protein